MELMVCQLSKHYKDKIAVNEVNLRLTTGINGLLGANGAGKTTLMRMLCGTLIPTFGSISLDGLDVSSEDYRAVLGYLPQDFGYYPNFTGMDFLLYLAALKGLSKSHAKRKTAELLKLVGLESVGRKKIKTYSGGMKQRLGIAQALLNDPWLLVVDEPTVGLDPQERVRFRNLITELGKDTIVLLSTHIVSDVEPIADHMLMMSDGNVIFDNPWNKERTDLEQLYLREVGGQT
jgi:ABC-2 type transport system ATP-binding protein